MEKTSRTQQNRRQEEEEKQPADKVAVAEEVPLQVLSVRFNQDHDCFVAGTTEGFEVYTVSNTKNKFSRGKQRVWRDTCAELNGGISRVETLYGSNIFALIGGGDSPRWPQSKVVLWDDHSQKCIGELSFNSEVKDVRLRYDK